MEYAKEEVERQTRYRQRYREQRKRKLDPGTNTITAPVSAQGSGAPRAFSDRRLLTFPCYDTGSMAWANDELALSLAVLEGIRRLLGSESSALVLVNDLLEQVNRLLGQGAAIDQPQLLRVIQGWQTFPCNESAVEVTGRRVCALIERYRQRGRQYLREGRYLSQLGTFDYLDALTDGESERDEQHTPLGM